MKNPSAEAVDFSDEREPSRKAEVIKLSRRRRSTSSSAGLLVGAALSTALISVGLCLVVGFYASAVAPDFTDRIVLCFLLLLPAMTLITGRSGLLVDYLLIIVATNRELRRLLDWGQGQYDPTPLSSLLPLAITGAMVVTIIVEWREIPTTMRRASFYLALAMFYGLALGMVGYGFGAFITFGEYVTPLIVLYYCVAIRPSQALLNRWIAVAATLGVLVGAYGIYQWVDPPPWDVTWLIWSKMSSSMGAPRPYELSICSTLESRGPAAMFFAAMAALLLAIPFLQRVGGFVLAAIPAIALLLTQARTGLIYLVLSLIASAIFARRGGAKIILALIAAGGLTVFVLARNQQSTVIFDRVGTLGDLQNDGSANGRVGIAQQGVLTVLTHPLGFGFGSGGQALKVADSTGEQQAVGDNGYLEILSTLGVIGTLFYAIGLTGIIHLVFQKKRLPTAAEPTTRLGLGMLVALAPTLMVSNHLVSAHACYVWVLLSRHLAARQTAVRDLAEQPSE